jgi:hypothetical protein
MQKSFSPIIAGCVVLAAIICTAPKSASATVGAAPAIHYGEIDANMVQEVGRRYWRGRGMCDRMLTATAIGPTAITATRSTLPLLSAIRLLWWSLRLLRWLWLPLLAPPRNKLWVQLLTSHRERNDLVPAMFVSHGIDTTSMQFEHNELTQWNRHVHTYCSSFFIGLSSYRLRRVDNATSISVQGPRPVGLRGKERMPVECH